MKKYTGLFIAVTVMSLWMTGLLVLLNTDIAAVPHFLIVMVMAVQTFLYTGLFITVHDVIHQSIMPDYPKVNKWFGTISLAVYALFSFKRVREKHWQHHRLPASSKDPDFHDGTHKQFWSWYFHFIRNYFTLYQLIGMAILFIIYAISRWSIFSSFWVIPSLLSTLQLFYFGTYLPHRESAKGYKDHHRARCSEFNILLSFLTCYHFGHHWEYHAWPNVPWWKLPEKHKKLTLTVLREIKNG